MTEDTTTQTRTGVELYRLHTAADLSELTRIRHQLRESVALLDGSVDLPDFLNELELAVVETATNVIRHTCQCEPARTLTHIVSVDVPEEIEPAEEGMGLFIIAQCVDSIALGPSCDGLQAIVLTKSLNKGE